MWKRYGMKIIRALAAVALAVMLWPGTAVSGDISPEKAMEIGETNLQKLIDQSYHYRVDYDTVICLPVHSRTSLKNDFYLLYFLNENYFQVEMEIDKTTGTPVILAMGKMSPPYHAVHIETFSHRYFNADSILYHAGRRQRMEQDSVRLVYYGVIPRLGKRGVIWESFSSEGVTYFSLDGAQLGADDIVREINTNQHAAGNYAADSIRLEEIDTEMHRLAELTGEQKQELNLTARAYDSLMTALRDEKREITLRFPKLGTLSKPNK